ncbi:MAG: fimbrial assembly protein [Terracidiphilus sp.]
MRIALNLATRPFADLGPMIKRLRIAMGVLALVSAGLLLGLHALHSKAEAARARAHSLDGAIARVTAQQQRSIGMMKEPANANLLRQTVALNKLFDEKAFSWTLTMENLETVLPGGVQVATLEPVREKNGDITLHMRVLGPRDKGVVFVSNLEHSKRFLLPRIVDESAESANAPGQKLEPVSDTNRFSFDLLATYNPPSPREIEAGEKAADSARKVPKEQPGAAAERVPNRTPYSRPRYNGPPYKGMETPAASQRRAGEQRPAGIERPAARSKPDPDVYARPGGPQ